MTSTVGGAERLEVLIVDAKAGDLPVIIQGGMGAGVSNWRLANAVSAAGQLGVVSGTGIDSILARRLQLGDPDGDLRRALEAFPIPGVADRLLGRYFVPGGKAEEKRYRTTPMPSIEPSPHHLELMVAANFVEVYLAKEGHPHPVGINYLEKIQPPTLASLYGAMLAGVDVVLMGAGIPRAIPAVLDRLAAGLPVELKLDVKGAGRDDDFNTRFDPVAFTGGELPPVSRPVFLAIVASHVLAVVLARKSDVPVDGFVVEGPTAGGHNAPPRGKGALSAEGEPLYGDKDVPDLEVMRDLGLPFWLAGSWGRPERVDEALSLGAAGVQVGTAFAFCEESGFDPTLKRQVLELSRQGRAGVFTDPVASPTGFPFKMVRLDGTASDDAVYESRDRICNLGYLRTAYKKENGQLGWRCPGEPVGDYVRKGGSADDSEGRRCLCNALLANLGLNQIRRSGEREPALVTAGDDVADVAHFLRPGSDSYRAIDVIAYLLPDGAPARRPTAGHS